MVIKNWKHFINFQIKLSAFFFQKKIINFKIMCLKKIKQGSKNKFKSSNPKFNIFIDSANLVKFYLEFYF